MRIKVEHPQSGIALIIALLMIVFFGILAADFALSMKIETKLARNASHDVEFEWLGRSGIELARYVLAMEFPAPGKPDSLRCRWAGGPGYDTNGGLMEIPLQNFQLGNGSFSVKIVDQDRKFNINCPDEQMMNMVLDQALTIIGVDPSGFTTIKNSILDWRDPSPNARMDGAKSDTYKNYSPPYFAKDGPLDDLSELLLVRGITPAMYWGASGGGSHMQVLNRPTLSRRDGFEEPAYAVGFHDLFTTLSRGRININTASAIQLQVVPGIDEQIAQAIIMRRAGPDGMDGTEDDMPFLNEGMITEVPGLPPFVATMARRFFTVMSSVFEVRVDVQIDNERRQYVAMLNRRAPRDIQVLYMYWQ